MAGAGYYFYCAGYIGFNGVIWQKKDLFTFFMVSAKTFRVQRQVSPQNAVFYPFRMENVAEPDAVCCASWA